MRASECPTDSRLCDLVDGALAADDAVELDLHLDACPSCRRVVSELGKLVAIDEPARQSRAGRYELGDIIGTGGMGVVYEARDPVLGRTIAVKVLDVDPGAPSSPDLDHRLAEARALARVRHPGVIAIHDVGVADGRVFIAMEYVHGEPLDRWASDRRRTWREVADVMIAAGRALAAVHASGLTHGDFKPSNVLVGRDGRVQVIDFGLAVLARGDRGAPSGGTPAFLAPERRRGVPSSYAADQYSFCATFDALRPTGTVPLGIRRAIARGRSVDPAQRHPDMPALIERLERARRRPSRLVPLLALGIGAIAVLGSGRRATSAAPRAAPPMLDEALREPHLADVLAPLLFGADPSTPATLDELERAAAAQVAAASRGCVAATIDGPTVTYRARDCVVGGDALTGVIAAHYRTTPTGVAIAADAAGLELAGARITTQLAATVDRAGRIAIEVRDRGRGPFGGQLESSRQLVRTIDAQRCTEVTTRWTFLVRGTRWTGSAQTRSACPGESSPAGTLEYADDASRTVIHATLRSDGGASWTSSRGTSGSY